MEEIGHECEEWQVEDRLRRRPQRENVCRGAWCVMA